jgi:hypothetical protein
VPAAVNASDARAGPLKFQSEPFSDPRARYQVSSSTKYARTKSSEVFAAAFVASQQFALSGVASLADSFEFASHSGIPLLVRKLKSDRNQASLQSSRASIWFRASNTRVGVPFTSSANARPTAKPIIPSLSLFQRSRPAALSQPPPAVEGKDER